MSEIDIAYSKGNMPVACSEKNKSAVFYMESKADPSQSDFLNGGGNDTVLKGETNDQNRKQVIYRICRRETSTN